ncbi:universal stress protein [Cupriavidus pinatubonensis]|uniref:universal stress protein n=1 Tax=Cupriavidus pinatubonensis TaxID=248026 RepID=UPI00112C5596|nr:universal stress protein [Cupriavidus pinatubonensis]TPQ31741.1 universal stress protein [Cupriavidus pinatubonensis]
MYQKILVAIDGSHCSDLALDEAIGIADVCHGHMEIVHVVDSGYELTEVRAGLIKRGQGLLANAQAKAEARDVRCHVLMVDDILTLGDIANQLRQVAQDCHAQLVVVGTHGHRGVRRLLRGSVAERLVRQCSVPVLLVRSVSEI